MTTKNRSKNIILFIDDEKICHTLVDLIIPNFTEYQVISAFQGSEAIDYAKRYANDLALILSDILLPDINGYEIYNILKADKKFANIPFIFQSGLDVQEQQLKKYIHEPIKIIHKPYKQEDLLKLIAEEALK